MALQKNGVRSPTFLYGLFEALLVNTVFPGNPSKKNHEYAEWDGLSGREVEYVSGACLVVRRELFEKVGLLDENILMYWEDADLCRRIRSAGYKVCFFPEAKVIHHWGKTAKKEGQEVTERIFNQSMIYFYRKHYGRAAAFVIRAAVRYFKNPLLKIWRAVK
jgi:hypothetical protein